MKSIFTSILILLTLATEAQTKRIAHLSHSGSLDFFSPKGDDSFGLPPMTIDSLIFLNDTTMVQISSIGGDWHVQKDTIINHPLLVDEAISVDSMRSYYRFGNTSFIGFEQSKKCPAPSSSMDSDDEIINVSSDAGEEPKIRVNESGQVELELLKDEDKKDSIALDTLVKPKEHIHTRGEYKNDMLTPSFTNNDGNGGNLFHWFVGSLLVLSISFYSFLIYRQSKLA